MTKTLLSTLKSGLTLSLIALGLYACSSDEPNGYTGTPTAYLSLENNIATANVSAEQTDPITLEIKLSDKSEQAQTFTLSLSGEGAEDLELSQSEVKVPAGTLIVKATITPKVRSLTETAERKATITLSPKTGSTYIVGGSPVVLTIQPAKSYTLTAEQKALVEGYKKNLGIDLSKILGSHICTGTVDWAGYGDYGDSYDEHLATKQTRQVKDQIMVVTLSPKATATQPILRFAYNSFGLNDLMNEIWNSYTITSPTWATATPEREALVKQIAWSKTSSETFNVVLDDVRLSTSDKSTLSILGDYRSGFFADYPYATDAEERIVVPFAYESSVWTRLMAQTKKDPTFLELITGSDMDMYDKLSNERVDENALEDSTTPNWVETKASLNLQTGAMNFVFPFYVENGDAYNVVRITTKARQ